VLVEAALPYASRHNNAADDAGELEFPPTLSQVSVFAGSAPIISTTFYAFTGELVRSALSLKVAISGNTYPIL
jgi:hypothetical protein